MFEKMVTGVHRFVNNYLPFIWGWLYAWGHFIILPLRVFIAGFNYKLTKSYVDDFHPDVIITTQTTASAIIAYLKKQKLYTGLFGIAFSDFHLHRYWLYDQADFYLVNIEEQKQQMLKLGISESKIFVCGMALKPKAMVNVDAVKNKFGIGEQDKTVLIGSGSLGTGVDGKLISQFVDLPNIKVIAVCGKNQAIYQNLKKQFEGTKNISILGFYSPMDELYATADVFITKPGGLSVSEALRRGLPMVISHFFPGQERQNFNYLLRHNLVMPKTTDVAMQALVEIKSGSFKLALQNNPNLETLFVPNAAVNAVRTMV